MATAHKYPQQQQQHQHQHQHQQQQFTVPPLKKPKSKFSSFVLALFILVVLIASVSLTVFFLFRPKSPTIQITSISFPSFSSLNNSVSFTFSQHASVSNPNRASFSHYDSTINLLYGNQRVGFMYIPAGEIGGGVTQFMEASFSVDRFGLMEDYDRMEMELIMRIKGRVRVMKVLMHRVEAVKTCFVAVRIGNARVLGVRC